MTADHAPDHDFERTLELYKAALDEACRIIMIISPYGGPTEVERIREIAAGITQPRFRHHLSYMDNRHPHKGDSK